MRNYHLLFAATIAIVSASAVVAQVRRNAVPPAALTDVTDCRAGCNGGEGNCQQSLKSASFAAAEGYRLVAGSQKMVRQWNASDSPGLSAMPQWKIDPTYDEGKLIGVTISPIISTCIGVSPDTQGVTFYEWRMLQRR